MVKLLFSACQKELSDDLWNVYIDLMPEDQKIKINRLKRWQGRHASLLGKLLLREGMKRYGIDASILDKIIYNKHGRPFFLGNGIDFNISHSGEYIVCAVTDKGKVGVDVEKIRPVKVNQFKRWLTPAQYRISTESNASQEKFFEFWTMNESIIKGDGRGLQAPIREIKMDTDRAVLGVKTWYLKKINLHPSYKCHIAFDQKKIDVEVEELRWS